MRRLTVLLAFIVFLIGAEAFAAADSCTAGLELRGDEYYLDLPIVKYTDTAGQTHYYYGEFLYVPKGDDQYWLKLTTSGEITDTSSYSSCQPSTLAYSGSDLMLHINNLEFNSTYLSADLEYAPSTDGNIWFVVISTIDSPFGFHPAGVARPGYANNGYSDAQNIGVKWARQGVYAFWFLVQPDLSKSEYDFSRYDTQWSAIPGGINILANIVPQGNLDEGYCLAGSYLPVDSDKYIAFVKATVERYDGDGVDDMPELANPIKYWQVGNEPSVYIAKDFAELQRITYTAIKEACPDCKVLIGGVAGMPPADNYIKEFDRQFKPILDALGGKYVDIMDFHWYGNAVGDYLGAKEAFEHIQAALHTAGFQSVPFWIAEMGAYSGDPAASASISQVDYAPQTERQQALDYLKRFVYPLSFGVKKIFPAFGLMEGFKYDGGYFDFTGLIYDGWGAGDPGLGVRKLSYYTYKKMTEMLEGSDWNNIQTIQEADDIYIYKLTNSGKQIYVAWWDYFNDSSYTTGSVRPAALTGIKGDTFTITEAVPMFSVGKDVVDYTAAFKKEGLAAVNGTLTFNLGDSPVYLEAIQ